MWRHRVAGGVIATLLSAVLALGAFLHVLTPFGGDQSSFLLGAAAIESGAVLYVDYWDIKQPGIFVFYWLGARLFAFTSWGVHLFELCYWAAVAAMVVLLLRPLLTNQLLALAVPVVFLATYFGNAGQWHATQVEVLACGPIAIAILLVCLGIQQAKWRRLRYYLAGVAAGVGLSLKLALAPVFLLLFAAIWVHLILFRRPFSVAPHLESCLAVLAGVATVIGPMCLWLASQGTLDEVIYTTFRYPAEVIEAGIPFSGGHDIAAKLASGTEFMVNALAALLVVIVVHAVAPNGKRGLLHHLSLMAIAGALISIALQIFSLWDYHFQIVFMPVAILAILAVDDWLTGAAPVTRSSVLSPMLFAWIAITAVAASQVASRDWHPALYFADIVVLGEGSYDDFERKAYPAMAELYAIAERSGIEEPGTEIYVFGSPTLYHLLDARQAIPVLGWFFELAAPSIYHRTEQDLLAARPQYIFMDAFYREIVPERSPIIAGILDDSYEVVSDGAEGAWYKLRP